MVKIELTGEEAVRVLEMCHDMIDINRQAQKQEPDPNDEQGIEVDTKLLMTIGDKVRQAKEIGTS